MNKLIIVMIALITTSFLEAMMINTLTAVEKKAFVVRISEVVDFGKTMIVANKISPDNPIHMIHNKLSDELNACNGDILKIITEHKLKDVIHSCATTIEETEDVLSLRSKIFDKIIDVNPEITSIMKELTCIRCKYSEEILQHLQPSYSYFLETDKKDEDSVSFMLKNEQYPRDEQAQKDYIAILIYQLTLAQRNPYDISYFVGEGPFQEMQTT